MRSGANVFLTGEAGSGKSFVVNHFRRELDEKEFPTLASTGAAAVLVGGRTFHSFFGLGILEGGPEATIERALRNRRVVRRLQRIQGFIVDEVSMLSAETLATAQRLCRLARESDEPWGGVQVIAVGDFAQLPPVTPYRQVRKWAFESLAWQHTQFEVICMKQNHRAQSVEFLSVLNQVRLGQLSPEATEYLNNRVVDWITDDELGTRLFPRLNQTEAFNGERLEALEGEEIIFETAYSGRQAAIEQLKKVAPVPEYLSMKVGAYVMLRTNDPKQRWVNGTTGTIVDITDEELLIELESGRTVKVEQMAFSLMDAEGQPVATATNFPISLAYAITIHKSQGLTLHQSFIDLQGLWEPGHAYVALSRNVTPEGLHILRWDPSSIKADPKVFNYYSQIGSSEAEVCLSEPTPPGF
jgi:ATP-dependent DNA helicase PIF1